MYINIADEKSHVQIAFNPYFSAYVYLSKIRKEKMPHILQSVDNFLFYLVQTWL